MSKPHLLLSLPSSGSDWLAKTIAQATGWRYFDKEFFNPICNPIPEIEYGFGCEMVTHFRKIARPMPTQAAFERWQSSGCEFNKEVYGAFCVPWFAERFECFVLLRTAEDTFPPTRCRVMAWYDAIWNSCQAAGMQLTTTTIGDKIIEAHATATGVLRSAAARLGIPVIEYRDLFDDVKLTSIATAIDVTNAGQIAELVATTRTRTDRPTQHH